MPGSPPTSTTEPATSPPPSTRSSSARPVVRRSAAPAVTAASGRGFWPLAVPARAPRARGSRSTSSTIVLHAPQPGHCPSQRGAAWPHCWQTKADRRVLSTMRALQVDKGGRTRHDPRVRVLAAELAALEDAGLRRRLRPLASASDAEVLLDGRRVLLLSSNNYLGLATHPAVKAAACAAIQRWGCGTGASRLIAGHLELHAALAEHYHSWLMVDEAHATGVLGPGGAGLAEAEGLGARVTVHMGTLGKALGAAGAYVAGARALVDLLVNRARTFIYTTGLAPAAVAAAGAAPEVVAAEPERRAALARNAATLREGLRALGLDARGDTHIVPLMVGDNRAALAFADALPACHVHAPAIRPPTVPPGTARLRVTPMATHTAAQLERALAAFADAARATGCQP